MKKREAITKIVIFVSTILFFCHVNVKEVQAVEESTSNQKFSFKIRRDKYSNSDELKIIDVNMSSILTEKYKSVEIRYPDYFKIENLNEIEFPTGWSYFHNANVNEEKSTLITLSDSGDVDKIQAFMTSLKFVLQTESENPGNISIILSQRIIRSFEHPDGKNHYYELLKGDENWVNNYNKAKKLSYKELTGYLATITSKSENDFIYEYTKPGGGTNWWFGGTRAVIKGEGINNSTKINDQNELLKANLEVNLGKNTEEWYWANGPEAGLVFFDKPTLEEGKVPSGGYAAWCGSSPDNNSGQETFLLFTRAGWSDVPISYGVAASYIVEYSEYSNQVESEYDYRDDYSREKIPNYINVRAKSTRGPYLTGAGSYTSYESDMRIGQIKTYVPATIKGYTFDKVIDADENFILSPYKFEVKDVFQGFTAIYKPLVAKIKIRYIDENRKIIPNIAEKSMTVYHGDQYNVDENEYYPDIPGYRFSNIKPDNIKGTVNSDNIIIELQYFKQKTVKFNSNGGSLIEDKVADANHPVAEPQNPVRNGYVFSGWYTSQSLNKKWDFEDNIIEDMTLYAKWLSNIMDPDDGVTPITPINEDKNTDKVQNVNPGNIRIQYVSDFDFEAQEKTVQKNSSNALGDFVKDQNDSKKYVAPFISVIDDTPLDKDRVPWNLYVERSDIKDTNSDHVIEEAKLILSNMSIQGNSKNKPILAQEKIEILNNQDSLVSRSNETLESGSWSLRLGHLDERNRSDGVTLEVPENTKRNISKYQTVINWTIVVGDL